MKAQAALDFLMTYGWALLIVVLVVGALFALGIFDIGTFMGNKTSGFTQIGVSGYKLDSSGVLTMKLKNLAGTNVNITQINATLGVTTISNTTLFALSNGRESGIFSVGNFNASAPSSGSSYSIRVNIIYNDTNSGFSYLDSGTLVGKVN
ncbi:Uncharacterised protein [Candidatus Anstonella stagnisolia]|nr:Uncharacterised protein [Candidatus Anstonella stagnisolia]